MSKDLTIGDVDRKLVRGGCTMQLSFSSGQYHSYVHRGGTCIGYGRGDDLEQAISRGCDAALPKEPIGVVPDPKPIVMPAAPATG